MPKQQPIPMTQNEFDALRAAGYGREGPLKDSFASFLHSGIGNVQKGDEFAIQQRRGMLAEVAETVSEVAETVSDDGSNWSNIAGIFDIAARIGALAFEGYRFGALAYQAYHFGALAYRIGAWAYEDYKAFRNEGSSSQPSMSCSCCEDGRVITSEPFMYDSMYDNDKSSENENHRGKIIDNLDFLNALPENYKDQSIRTLRLRQEDVKPTVASSRVMYTRYKGNVREDVYEEQGIPTLKLREAVSSVQSTDECARANDYEVKVKDVVKGEVFNPTDKNLTKDSEKSETLRSTNRKPMIKGLRWVKFPIFEDAQAVTKKDSTAVEDVKAADKSGKEDSEKLQQLNQPLNDAPLCSSAIEEVKEEDLDAADRNGKEDSEKLKQVNQPTTDAPLEEAQANMKDEEKDEDFNGECAGKPDRMTKLLRRG